MSTPPPPPLPNFIDNEKPTNGKGTVEVVFEEGLHTYFTGSRDSKLAILLISDAFGYEAPNFRKVADKFGDEGYLVVVPDLLHGDPALLGIDPNFDIPTWRAAHTPEKAAEEAIALISALKKKGVYAVGAAGFGWGGQVLVILAKPDIIQVGVIVSPGPITADHINEVKIPFAILGAELDEYCLADDIIKFGNILSAKPKIESYTKIFPGVKHGWAVGYNRDDESAVKIAEEAHADTFNWLNKYIKLI